MAHPGDRANPGRSATDAADLGRDVRPVRPRPGRRPARGRGDAGPPPLPDPLHDPPVGRRLDRGAGALPLPPPIGGSAQRLAADLDLRPPRLPHPLRLRLVRRLRRPGCHGRRVSDRLRLRQGGAPDDVGPRRPAPGDVRPLQQPDRHRALALDVLLAWTAERARGFFGGLVGFIHVLAWLHVLVSFAVSTLVFGKNRVSIGLGYALAVVVGLSLLGWLVGRFRSRPA